MILLSIDTAAEAASTLSSIMLDPRIRDWVLLPIFLVMVMQRILRQNLNVLLMDKKHADFDDLRRGSALRRSQLLRAHGLYIPTGAFKMRKRHFLHQVFPPPPDKPQAAEMPMQDPLMMVGMMKQNAFNIVPQIVLGAWISYFFSGFVLVRFPFSIPERFRVMLQRGINLSSLDVSYVSSLSWYLLLLFGLQGFFSLILGSGSDMPDEAKLMEQQMNAAAQMQAQDPSKAIQQERNELEIVDPEYTLWDAEERLLRTFSTSSP